MTYWLRETAKLELSSDLVAIFTRLLGKRKFEETWDEIKTICFFQTISGKIVFGTKSKIGVNCTADI